MSTMLPDSEQLSLISEELPVEDKKALRRRKQADYQRKYVENNKEKVAEYRRKYYENNKEKILERSRKYYENNKEKAADYQRKYVENNKEKVGEIQRKYRENNKEKLAEYRREYYENNKEKVGEIQRKYRENNPFKSLNSQLKRRAKEKNLPFNLTDDYLKSIYPDNSLCPVFGILMTKSVGSLSPDSPSVDRIVPELGYVKGNVIFVSMKANRIKSDASPEEILAVGRFYKKLLKEHTDAN